MNDVYATIKLGNCEVNLYPEMDKLMETLGDGTEHNGMSYLSARVKYLKDVIAGSVGYWDSVTRPKDWACRECSPDSDCLVKGFRCAYHEAKWVLSEHSLETSCLEEKKS